MKVSSVVLVAALASGSFAAALPARSDGGNEISTLAQDKNFWSWIKKLCEWRKKHGNNWGGGGGSGGNFPNFPGGFPGGGSGQLPDGDNEFPDGGSGFPDDGAGGLPGDGSGNPDNGAGFPDDGAGGIPDNGSGFPDDGTGNPDNGTGLPGDDGTGGFPDDGTGEFPDDGTGEFPDDGTGGFPDDGTGNPDDNTQLPGGDTSGQNQSGFPGSVNTQFPPGVPITEFPVLTPTGSQGIGGIFPSGTGSGIAFPTGTGSVIFPIDPISGAPTQILPTPVTPITPITPAPSASIKEPDASVGLPVVSDSGMITNVGVAPTATGTRSFDNVKFTSKV